MRKAQKITIDLGSLWLLGGLLVEVNHLYRYDHLAPLRLHVDVLATTSDQIPGVKGTAKIHRARLTNFGVFPTAIVACNSLVNGIPETSLNYAAERCAKGAKPKIPLYSSETG